jgi:hypothetical protein
MPDLPPKYDPTGVGTHQSDDETNDPVIADHLNFYKVEKWTKDGSNVDHMLYAGNNLDKAREVFAAAIKHRPRIRLTIRQRTQVLERWPVSAFLAGRLTPDGGPKMGVRKKPPKNRLPAPRKNLAF